MRVAGKSVNGLSQYKKRRVVTRRNNNILVCSGVTKNLTIFHKGITLFDLFDPPFGSKQKRQRWLPCCWDIS